MAKVSLLILLVPLGAVALQMVENPVTIGADLTVKCSVQAVGGVNSLMEGDMVRNTVNVSERPFLNILTLAKSDDGNEEALAKFNTFQINTRLITHKFDEYFSVRGNNYNLNAELKLTKPAQTSDLGGYLCRMYFCPEPRPSVRCRTLRFRQKAFHQTCGKTEHSASGIFESPDYPRNYTNNLECGHSFEASEGKVVELIFEAFELQGAYMCRYDSVKIYDGPDKNSALLETYCNEYSVPDSVRSTGRHMYLEFSTDNSVTKKGFKGTYREILPSAPHPRCGSTFTSTHIGPRGRFQSPLYPGNYPANLFCGQSFEVSEGKIVELTFEVFDVQTRYYHHCRYDKVKIYDGPDRNSPLMGTYCGTSLPGPLRSTGRHMYVELKSGIINIRRGGFKGTYREVIPGCSLTHVGPSGDFQSPGYPRNLANNLECGQNFEVSDGKLVELTFFVFELDYSSDCREDSVKIYDGPDRNSSLIGTYCGISLPGPLRSTGRHMYVELLTDSAHTKRGFTGMYKEVTHGCDFTHFGPSGSFKSPDYPRNYTNNLKCGQSFEVSRGKVVELTFEAFDIRCLYDRVEFRDGPNRNSPLIDHTCNPAAVPSPLRSSGRHMYVELVTDDRFTDKGFNGTYREVTPGANRTV